MKKSVQCNYQWLIANFCDNMGRTEINCRHCRWFGTTCLKDNIIACVWN